MRRISVWIQRALQVMMNYMIIWIKILQDYGFVKHGLNYKLSIPLYAYKRTPVISVNFLVTGTNDYIGYDVIDNNSDMIYSAYYDTSQTNENKVLDKIKQKLNKVFEEMVEKNILEEENENAEDC